MASSGCVTLYTNKANVTDDSLTSEDNRADKMKFRYLADCAPNLAFKEDDHSLPFQMEKLEKHCLKLSAADWSAPLHGFSPDPWF